MTTDGLTRDILPDRRILLGQVNISEETRSPDLISAKRGDDRGAICERDVIIDGGRPESLCERNTRVIHDTTFTTEIGADVHLRLVEESNAHPGDVRGR